MKKIYLLAFIFSAFSSSLFSQNVNVSGALVGNGTYPDLGSAFTAINGGAQTGATIQVDIVGNTTELASAVLNQSAGPWTSLTITPSGGIGRTISGNIAGHLIDLNGADNVTIDGGPSKFLTFDNSNTGSSTSTLRFINDATNNTVTQTNINGSAGNALGTGFGVIYFATGTTTGNDNNTISICNITASSGGTPLNAIYSLGSSAAIDNSNNTVTVCNISNFFSAGTASNGMNINSFNSAWSITNNSFYQTISPRTATSANTHTAINILSGTGYTVSNNIIGGSNPSGGSSAWALAGTIASRFIGINITSNSGTTYDIQNNTVTNFTLNTSSGATTTNGIWCAINFTGTGNANIGTTTGNTIGATSGTGSVVATSTTAGGLLVGINCSSTGTIAIQNNSFGAFTCSGITAAVSGSITGINISGAAYSINISNNIIGNSTADNMRGGTSGLTTGSSLVCGINLPSATSPTNIAIANNTIRNLSSYGTGTTGFVRGIQTGVALNCSTATVTGNTIFNLTSNNANVSVANAQLAAQGIYYNIVPATNPDISGNTIYNISLTNAGLLATNVAGISVSNATAFTVTKNTIYGLSNASTATSTTAPGVVAGIHIRGVNTSLTVANNMISLGNSQTTNTAFIGMWYQGGGSLFNALLYYNSVNIEGTATAGAQPSFGFYRGNFSATAILGVVDIRNNILNNTRSGGTGAHIAIANNYGATASATGWVSGAANNNVLNAASPANIGWWTTARTFTSWKTASSGDLLSVSGVAVPFTATATADLHLFFGVTPTQIESGGVAISGITVDYDNQVRPGPTGSVNGGALAPDIGADEFDAVPLDLFGPTITYTLIGNNNCTVSKQFSAYITDISGVNVTPGTRPRLYYKKSTDANAWNDNTNATVGWKYVEATNASSPFNFVFDYTLLFGGAGVVGGDNVQYFVVAQDLSPAINVAINSGSFALTPASVNLTSGAFPIGGTINSFNIITSLATTITVGAAGDYTSLTGAAGLFNAINTKGLTGNTTVNILDASVTEAGTVALNQMQSGDCSATAYTLLIKPNTGVTSTLTGTLASSALIRILSSNVTIDGSNNGTTSRNLTITNTSITGPSVILIGSTGIVPVTNTTVKNSTIINGVNTNTAIVVSDVTSGTAGYFNNITIQNNNIQLAYIGVYSIAVSASGNGSGLLITGNDINTAGANSIRLSAIYVQGVDGATVSNNNIANIADANGETPTPVWLATGTVNSTVSNNTISGISLTNTGAFGIYPIYVTPGVNPANITVTGNTISNITSAGSNIAGGILIGGATTNVTVSGNTLSNISYTGTGAGVAYALYVSTSVASSNINITGNSVSGVTSAGTGTNTGLIISGSTGGVTIQKNNITNVKNTNATGFGANGMFLVTTNTASNIKVYNNFISDVAAVGFAGSAVGDNGYGIMVNSGGGYNIDYNSINMNTNQTTAGGLPAAINIGSGVITPASVNLRNNIFNHSAAGGSTQRYAIYSSAASNVFGTIDYNDYYTTAANIGNIAATDRATIGAMQAGFGGNTYSLSIQPNFTSSTDLHLLAGSNCRLDGYGTPIAGITTDYDSQTRDAGAPDMGADEFTTAPAITTMAMASSCDQKNVSPLGTYYTDGSCNRIAYVLPSGGGSAVGGQIKTCLTIDATQLSHNGEPYVQRHYDIEPAISAGTATATVTLYFTDAEFTLYNTNNPTWPQLPTVANGGNGDANRANLKVTQFHGVGSTNPTAPGYYPGVRVLIIPGAANVVYNGTYWEVTFPVTGFSGFYVHTNYFNNVLPISVNYLNGHKQGSTHVLDWKVTCNSTPRATMTLQRSADARAFSDLYSIAADAARCNSPFDYTDANPLTGMNYYRLKIVDADGKITYSTTVALLNAVKGFDIISIAPNPVVSGNFKLNVASAQAGKMDLTIIDMQGRLVNRQSISLIAGFNSLPVNVSNLASGTYALFATTGEDKSRVVRFVKQ